MIFTTRRLIALAEVVLCSSVPTQLAIGFVLRLIGWTPSDGSGQLSFTYVLTLSLGDTALLIALMVALMRAHGESPRLLWLGRRPVRGEVVVGLLQVPIVFLMVIVMLNLLQLAVPSLHNVPENPLEQLA